MRDRGWTMEVTKLPKKVWISKECSVVHVGPAIGRRWANPALPSGGALRAAFNENGAANRDVVD